MVCKKEDQEHCHVFKQYMNLNDCYDKVLYELYDRHYYNYGIDTYSCNKLAADDMIYKIKLLRRVIKTAIIALSVQAFIILSLVAYILYIL